MSNLGGYELVESVAGDPVSTDRGAAVLRSRWTFVRRRRAAADAPPAPPPRCRRHGIAFRRRQLGTVALGLAMLFSMTRVTTWHAGGDPFHRRGSGAGRVPASWCTADYPSLRPRSDEYLLHADLRGDGCEVPVVWDGVAVRFRLDPSATQPTILAFHDDDRSPLRGHLLLGDWDCDGTDAPTLYLPRSGEIVTFHRMDDSGEPVRRMTQDSGIRMGHARMTSGPDGCDAVEILTAA